MKKKLIKFLFFAVIFGLVVIFSASQVLAGNLDTLKDILNRLVQSQESGVTHTVIFTTATAIDAGTNTVVITAPDADDGLWCRTADTLNANGCADEGEALPGTLTATCTQGNGGTYDIITVSGVGALVAETKYCVKIDDEVAGALGTPTAGEHVMEVKTVDDGTDVDTGEMTIQILTSDQVAVSGKIGTTLAFSITEPEVGFGTWTATEDSWANKDKTGSDVEEPATGDLTTLGASTNAGSGLTITIKSTGDNTDPGLYSSATGILIPAAEPNLIAEGTAGYAAYGANDTGGLAGKIVTGFQGTTGTTDLTLAAQSFIVATGNVSSDSTVDLVLYAAVHTSTPAGTYSDTLTLNCTGNF